MSGENPITIGYGRHFIDHQGKIQNPDDVGQRNEVVAVPFALG